ncbi:rod-binding protein [Maritalea porphyrae]|jgi:flagellar protein FlgJ|uniref:rod-binding protein n=1 Tax=Maritalea porphyrae TaxID=880732 RepID=UPI0022AF4911|nr:rod-binding protein [Maritalea porphyrae]MCZ4272695.1 rod-binding protein [Maritalea porphyrae]
MAYSQIHIPVQRPAHMPEQAFNQLKSKAVELEGVFLNTLLSQVSSSVDTEGDFGGGYGEETWRGMQASEMANSMAQAGGIGLSDSILRDLIATQAASNSPQFTALPGGAYKK